MLLLRYPSNSKALIRPVRLVDQLQRISRSVDLRWKREQEYDQQAAGRSFTLLQKQFNTDLLIIAKQVEQGVHVEQQVSLALFNKYYKKAFQLGLKHSGRAVLQAVQVFGGRIELPTVDIQDSQWVARAAKGELNFWLNFLKNIRNNNLQKFTIEQRVGMYVKSLEAQYSAGKIAGAPQYSLVYWNASPTEKCSSCLYLAEQSPFPKELAIVTPRSSFTSCRTNCNCSIRVVNVSPEEYKLHLARFDRAKHIKRLRQLFLVKTTL